VAEHVLQSRFREEMCVEDLASGAGMSARNFLRRFKAATGRLPSDYLRAVRIESAKAMLEYDRASVQSIATGVGYSDISFFRTLFKRSTGMTPAEYRAHFAAAAVRQHDAADFSKV